MAENSVTSRSAAKTARSRAAAEPIPPVRTVLFADLTGANQLYDTLGDARALMNITRCLVLLEEQALEHRGVVIKTIGDHMLCQFPDANTAASAAAAMHQRIEHYVESVAVELGLKIGLHSGPLIEDRGDVFGDAVNVTARLVKLAHPGQTLTDAQTVNGMRVTLRRRARRLDRLAVKGKSDQIELMELGWRRRPGAPLTTEQGTVLEQNKSACITLFFDGREIPIDSAISAFTIGRDSANDLSITSRKASRQHARIEWRRDKFVLFDHSTNGTYVTLEGEQEVLVKHESFLLRGRGVFSLGEAARARAQSVIAFECL